MSRLVRLVALFAILTVACSSTTLRPSQTADEHAVRAAMAGFMDALNALDAEGMAGFFADDITAFVPVAQPDRVQGKDAVVRIFQNFVQRTRPTTSHLNLVPEDLEVAVSGDLGLVSFNIREPAINVTRRRTFVFERSGGKWLIRHFHASDIVSK